MNNVRPKLYLLSEEQIEQAHLYTLHVPSETGVCVDSPSILALLEHKLDLKADGCTIHFPAEVVEEAIHSAPKTIDAFNRRGENTLTLGADCLRFGIGVTVLFYQEPVNDYLDPFTRKNFQDLVRVGSSLLLYDVVSTVGIVRDVPENFTDLYGSLEHIANTAKPLVLFVSDENQFLSVLKMFESLHGDLGDKPFILPYFDPISPLGLNAGTVDKMQFAIERGLPIIFSNYSMASASTSLTPAGTLSWLNAELVAGLVIRQTIRKGTPILPGKLPVYLDMRSMLNFYDPQSVLISVACSELMAHYGIPYCSTSRGTGWGMDLIAEDAYWMNTLSLLLSRGSLAPFVGDSHCSKSISPMTIIHVHEVIDQTLRVADGFQLDDARAALDEIAKVGPGGNFLSQPSTLENYKNGYYVSRVYPQFKYCARKRRLCLSLFLHQIDDHDELNRKGEEFIRKQ